MLFDNSGNAVQICEGGVWVDLGEVAKGLGVDTESFLGWASERLSERNDQLMDAIVDFAMDKIADIYRDETPDGARPDGKAPTDGQRGDDAPQATRRHPRVRGVARILRDNGWTPEFMAAEWERAVAALADGCPGGAFRMFVKEGYEWDSMPIHLIPKIPGLADRLYEAKERREEKEAEEARAKQAKIDARRHYVGHADEILVAKLDAGEELTDDEIADFLDYVPNYLEEEGEDGRWTRSVTTYCRTRDGRFFRVDWERGLTEMQENQYWCQPVEVTLHEEERTVPTVRRTWHEATGDVVLWSAGQGAPSVADDADVEARLVAKLDAGVELTEDEIGDFLEWLERFDEDEGEDGRWSRPVTTYCKTRDGRFFRVDWSRGLTEYQEDWYGSQPVEVSLTEETVETAITVRTWTEV